jgi:hypothetical protein
MEAGNAFLPEFMAAHNRRFGRPARNPHDAHRSLQGDEDLDHIFTLQEDRKLSPNLVVHFQRMAYLVASGPDTLPLAGKPIRVFQWEDGRVELQHQGRKLPYSVFEKNPCVPQGVVVENKRLGAALAVIQAAQAERDRAKLGLQDAHHPGEGTRASRPRQGRSTAPGVTPGAQGPDISTWAASGHLYLGLKGPDFRGRLSRRVRPSKGQPASAWTPTTRAEARSGRWPRRVERGCRHST